MTPKDDNTTTPEEETTPTPTRTARRRPEVRAYFRPDEYEIRSEDGSDAVLMEGYLVPWDEWTEIDSLFEGRFMERFKPSAFRKTLRENTPKVLFQHGIDPSIGDKPIGVPKRVEEREAGEWYRVELFGGTTYVRDLIPALEAGQLGASFRFSTIKEEFVAEPERSDWNPEGIPERTILEATLPEFGPVTFPAYEGATAGVRSRERVRTEEDFILAERRLIVPGSDESEEDRTPKPEPTPAPADVTPEEPRRREDYLGSRREERPPWAL